MSKFLFNQSGLLFLPRSWQRPVVLRWLKRTHAWTGFWGAMIFLLLGTSGFFLNHRSQMKIDTGEPVEVSAMDIAVPAGSIGDADALGKWAKDELGLTSEPRPPRGGPGEGKGGERRNGGAGREKAGDEARKAFLGKEHEEAEKIELGFNHPNGKVTVEHVAGSASVSVKQESQNFLGFIKNLHKGSGVGIAWILLIDTIAGALITMSLTGFLLWTRLHGSRIVGGGIVIASIGAFLAALWPSLL